MTLLVHATVACAVIAVGCVLAVIYVLLTDWTPDE